MKLSFIHCDPSHNPHAKNIILLHGVFGQARNLGTLQRALCPYYNCYAFDMRSHGKSAHAPLSYPEMAQDVLETIDSLGLEKISLIGHSMGGKVAMATALYAPARIEKLLVADIAPTPTHYGQNELAQKLSSLILPRLENRKDIHHYLLSMIENADIASLIGQHIQTGNPAKWTIGIKDIAQSFENIEGWDLPPSFNQQWNGPALFIRGGNSPYITQKQEEVIKRLFPQAKIETISGAGHWVHAEKPEEFCKIMLDFLETTTEDAAH